MEEVPKNQLTAFVYHTVDMLGPAYIRYRPLVQHVPGFMLMSRHVQTVGTFWLTFGSTSFMTEKTCFEAADFSTLKQ